MLMDLSLAYDSEYQALCSIAMDQGPVSEVSSSTGTGSPLYIRSMDRAGSKSFAVQDETAEALTDHS
jgi:hypothetical protein